MAYPSVEETLPLVLEFDPRGDARAERSQRQTINLLELLRAPFDRSAFDPGHITASAVVLAPDREHVLLVFHEKLRRWLQPGGHCEPSDQDVRATARRETREETGIALSNKDSLALAGIDVHDIPAAGSEPSHRHHDLCFLAQATLHQIEAMHSSDKIVWCPIIELDRYDVDLPLRACLARSLHVTL